MSSPELSTVEEEKENAKSVVVDVLRSLLDSYYDEHPRSNAYGTGYDHPDEQDGSVLIGRESAEESDSGLGVDYVYRKYREGGGRRRRNEEKEYLYGSYGWERTASAIVEHLSILYDALDDAVEAGYLDELERERLNTAREQLEAAVAAERDQWDLTDIAELIRNHETDSLQELVATDDEEHQVSWCLLHSKEDGEVIDNPVEVPVVSEKDSLLFARSERYYEDERQAPDGKWYAYGVVIGYDDTDERFFVHRLESDPDLRDEDFEWTAQDVKNKMGFDVNYSWISDIDDIPRDTTVRIQGDVAFVRRDYETKFWEHYNSKLEQLQDQLVSDLLPNSMLQEESTELLNRIETHISSVEQIRFLRSSGVSIRSEDTEELKAIQQEVDVDEESVRAEQEHRGIQRLTAQRRRDIISSLLDERIVDWACEIRGTSREELQAEAEERAAEEFEHVNEQVNEVIGNHALIAMNASEHPNHREYIQENDCRAALVVPEESSIVLWHDEHENKSFTVPRGVYEFKFLEGHEDQWWMN